jgi:hypothetical protein
MVLKREERNRWDPEDFNIGLFQEYSNITTFMNGFYHFLPDVMLVDDITTRVIASSDVNEIVYCIVT